MDSRVEELRAEIDQIHREIVQLLARRVELSVEIGKLKAEKGIDLRSLDREQNVFADVEQEAVRLGLDSEVVSEWFQRIVDYSRRRQLDSLMNEAGAEADD